MSNPATAAAFVDLAPAASPRTAVTSLKLTRYRNYPTLSLPLDGLSSADLVQHLARQGIRVHIRKDDHYCGNILHPLGLADCVRVSVCHYNTTAEVARFLAAMELAVSR